MCFELCFLEHLNKLLTIFYLHLLLPHNVCDIYIDDKFSFVRLSSDKYLDTT